MRGYLTPESLPATLKRRVLDIPTDPDFLAAFNGALLPLMDPANWQPFGAITPEQAAAKASEIIFAMWSGETDV
jgi:hypothetical protein